MRRRIISTLLLLAAIALLPGSARPVATLHPQPVPGDAFRDYTWYMDPDYTDPTGTVSDVNVEIYRLQCLFGGNTFTTTPSMGLQAFEWGYYPSMFPVIIYSDM